MAGTSTMAVTDTDFSQVILEHDGLALVDFWAEWCGPCHIIAPVVEQIAQEYEGRLRVRKLDVDSNQETAMRYNVRSIPTLLLFKGGNVVDSVVGAVPKAYLVEKIDQHLS